MCLVSGERGMFSTLGKKVFPRGQGAKETHIQLVGFSVVCSRSMKVLRRA